MIFYLKLLVIFLPPSFYILPLPCLYDLIIMGLYASVDIHSSELCRSLLKHLTQRSDLTRHIKKLIVRPNHPPGWANRTDKSIDESWVSSMIEEIALHDNLMALNTFLWDGLEMPNDSLWLTLRTRCPNLSHVGTSVGPKLQNFSAESQLFRFRNLTGFSLTTQRLVRWPDFRARQELPSTFWDMLLLHSPDLRELTLDATCRLSELWALRRALSGRWPRLQTLYLGVLSSKDMDDDEDRDMIDFFQAHQSLSTVATVGTTSYSHDSMRALTSLPRLTTLSTKLQRLKDPSPLCAVTILHLRDWFSPAARVDSILGSLPSIEVLSVCVNLSDSLNDQQLFFSRVLAACPQLFSLHLLSTASISLSTWTHSVKTIQTKLRCFTLTRTSRTHEFTLPVAVRIAQANHSLQEFTFRDVAPTDRQDLLNGLWRTRQLNTYLVVVDGNNRYLRCHESGVGALGARYSKNFSRELPTMVHPRNRVEQIVDRT